MQENHRDKGHGRRFGSDVSEQSETIKLSGGENDAKRIITWVSVQFLCNLINPQSQFYPQLVLISNPNEVGRKIADAIKMTNGKRGPHL